MEGLPPWRGSIEGREAMTQAASTTEIDFLAGAPDEIQRQLQTLEQELQSLQTEITMLRRRDEVLKIYNDRLDEELRLASKLQRDFLPRTLPEIGRIRFHTL